MLYGSKPPPNDSLWIAAKRQGFEVVVHELNPYSGREKKVDTNVATDITPDSFELMQPTRDEITLVAGDATILCADGRPAPQARVPLRRVLLGPRGQGTEDGVLQLRLAEPVS